MHAVKFFEANRKIGYECLNKIPLDQIRKNQFVNK